MKDIEVGKLINDYLQIKESYQLPDLFGFRRRDGKMFFLEVKSKKGRRTPEQKQFEELLNQHENILYGVAKSLDDALRILQVGEYREAQ